MTCHAWQRRLMGALIAVGAIGGGVVPSLLAAKDATMSQATAKADAQRSAEAPASPAASSDPVVAPSAPSVAASAPAVAKPSPEDEVRAQLDGTQWSIELTPLSGEKGKPQKDMVKFSGRTMSSERMGKAGYPGANISITIGGDGVPVWETMQTKEGEGVTFWRGELHGTTMRGVLSKHPTNDKVQDFSFSGRELAGKSVGAAGGASPASASQANASSAPTSPAASDESPKKKKRRRFF